MTTKISNSYFTNIKIRYSKSTKEEKKQILDEFISISGYNRKYSIRIFNEDITIKVKKKKAERKHIMNRN